MKLPANDGKRLARALQVLAATLICLYVYIVFAADWFGLVLPPALQMVKDQSALFGAVMVAIGFLVDWTVRRQKKAP